MIDSTTAARVLDDLDEIPRLYAELPDVKTGIKGNGTGTHNAAGSRMPVSAAVLALLSTTRMYTKAWKDTDPRAYLLDHLGVIPHLARWVVLVIDNTTPDDRPANPMWYSVASLTDTLRSAWPWILTQDWAHIFAGDITALRGTIERVLGIPPTCRPKCPNVFCGETLERKARGSYFECPACHRQIIVREQLEALATAQHLPGADVAQLLDIPWPTLRYWRQERWIKPVARTDNIDLYDLDTVRAVRDTPAADRARIA